MQFNHTIPDWENTGTEPSENLRKNGFQGGQKPPAGIFNWFFSKVSKAFNELQTKSGYHAEDYNNPHKVTAEQTGAAKVDLSNVDATAFKGKAIEVGVQGTPIVEATSTDGITYYADISEYFEDVYNGLQFVIIPEMASNTTSPRLMITTKNAVYNWSLVLPTTQNTRLYDLPANVDFIGTNAPILITLSTDKAFMTGFQSVRASNLKGTVPIEKGGTNATTGAQALINLGGAKKDLSNVEDEVFAGLEDRTIVTATSLDGITYNATVDGVESLKNGMQIVIIPLLTSASTNITLNVNGLGAVPIRQPLSFSTFVATIPETNSFLRGNVPCRLMYHSTYTTGGIWLMADKVKYSAQDLYGSVQSTYIASIPTSWTEDTVNGGYKQTVNVNYILATDTPTVDVYLTDNAETNKTRLKAWGCVDRITTADGSITLYAYSKAPETAFEIQLKVVR